ncbi:MAG: DsbA family protein [Pseudomonadota bacterium]
MTKFTALTSDGLTRRAALSLAAGIGLAAGFVTAPALAQQAGDVPVEKLMAKGELDELSVGSPDAKVVIIEYASMTCPHCARFHTNVYPELKKKYIDTGKARLIMREFPLDNLAAAASMLARCTDTNEKAVALTNVLFKKQNEWVVRGNPVPRLFEIAKQAGFTEKSFNACLQDQELLNKIARVREKGSKEFNVSATPTFFINGKRLRARSDDIASFDAAIEPILKGDS